MLSTDSTVPRATWIETERAMTVAVRDVVVGSPRPVDVAGGAGEIQRMLEGIENVWLDHADARVHGDFHRSADTLSDHEILRSWWFAGTVLGVDFWRTHRCNNSCNIHWLRFLGMHCWINYPLTLTR